MTDLSGTGLYPFQERAVTAALRAFETRRRIVIASAVGSGKTTMGASVAGALDEPTLWVAHTRELVLQAAETLRRRTGRDVGVVMPGYPESKANIHVATVQTLMGQLSAWKHIKLLVLDETHHYEADTWGLVTAMCPDARILGLTATPERADGRPLGNTFEELIEGAQYQELKRLGILVPWTIYHPQKHLGHNLAMNPAEAYAQFAEGRKCFAYHLRVDVAEAAAKEFRHRNIASQCVSCATPKDDRRAFVGGLSGHVDYGALDVIWNVYTMTEGVDVPEVSAILLARPFQFTGGYIQATGRGARRADGKTHAVLIDLVGSCLKHGPPDQDWNYSLDYGIRPKGAGGGEQHEPIEREYVEPVVDGCGLHLSAESSHMPFTPPEPPPVSMVTVPRAEYHNQIATRMARRSGRKTAAFVSHLTRGLSE